VKTFRWEIPYPCIIQLSEVPEGPKPSASIPPQREESPEPALEPGTLSLKNRPA
jgi:hypothetical protein